MVWPEPESLYGEDYGDLHYAMCKWLRDWEFDKFDIEYQYAFLEGFLRLCPPPPGVEFRLCHPERRSWSERRTPSRVCCRAAARIDRGQARIDRGAGCRQDPERRSWSEQRTPWKRSARFAAGIDKGAGCRQGAGPSGAPPRVFAAEPQPASTGAPAVGKTPSAGAGPSDAPPRVFAAEPQPASTGAPAVAKTPSAEAAPSDAPRRPKQSKTAEMLAKVTQQKVCT
eukprot:jgi/Tetstr1/444864/TSEL_032706.t1